MVQHWNAILAFLVWFLCYDKQFSNSFCWLGDYSAGAVVSLVRTNVLSANSRRGRIGIGPKSRLFKLCWCHVRSALNIIIMIKTKLELNFIINFFSQGLFNQQVCVNWRQFNLKYFVAEQIWKEIGFTSIFSLESKAL
jgi:hypothetical protein